MKEQEKILRYVKPMFDSGKGLETIKKKIINSDEKREKREMKF